MKYTLKCVCAHQFEAWFPNADAYETQRARGLVNCPACGGTEVEKALMAPSIVSARRTPPPASTPETAPQNAPAAPAKAMTAPEAMRRVVEERLRALRAYVEANSDYVGDTFAAEARAIHEGETQARAIYGEATPEEAEALEADGVPCAAIPWIQRRDDS